MRRVFGLLFLGLMTLSSGATELPLSPGETSKILQQFLSSAEDEGFHGTVLVAHDGSILLAQGYGVTDATGTTPVNSKTVFTTGSITKQFTATAILILEQTGKLSVHDPITRYFKNVPDDKRSITLHHLLTHTAGFAGAIGDDREKIDRDAFMQRALKSKLLFEPGSQYEYSNVGFSVLAAIVELLSEYSYEAFLHEHLFGPAGMTDTGYVMPDWEPERLAHGFKEDGSDWGTIVENIFGEDGPGWNLIGNGGIHSTAGDMYRWHQALSSDKILSAASKKKMYGRHADEGGSWYGYGWSIEDTPAGELITHNGGNPFYFSDFLRYPETDTVIYYSTTSRDRRMNHLARQLAQIVFRGELPELPASRSQTRSARQGPPAEPGSAAARWGLPGSFRGNRAAELLDAIVTDSDEARLAFIAEGFSPGSLERNGKDGLVRALRSLKDELGEFKIRGSVPEGPSAVTILIDSGKHDAPMRLNLTLEPKEPHRIESIGVEVGD